MQVRVERWCAWAPGIEDETAWRAWAQQPWIPDRARRAPAIEFVPPLQRRRCDGLARMLLHVARGCCPDPVELASLPVVLASRHGPFDTTVDLLEDIAAEKPLSPTAFSHSVHNTALGLLSIFAGNRSPSVALAARRDTFAHGYVEALALLHRSRSERVLFVTADERLPEALDPIADLPYGPYAVALLLARGDAEQAVGLRLGACEARPEAPQAWPDALEFLRWWIGGAAELRIAHAPRQWTWTRGGPGCGALGAARCD